MRIRILAAVMAAFFMLPALVVEARASNGENGDPGAPNAIHITHYPITDSFAGKMSDEHSAQGADSQGNGDENEPTCPEDEQSDDNGAATDDTEDCPPAIEFPPVQPPPPEQAAPLRPFTPPGTGEVLDNATSDDGKEFFTITTPDENVFYLIIDRQRGTQNVYFLNAVTESDLLSLATIPERPEPPVVEPPPVPVVPEPTPEPAPEPVPESSGGSGMMAIVVIIVLGAGGAGWYFKVYRPKQQSGGDTGEFDGEDYGDFDPYADDDENQPDYDSADWDSDDTAQEGDGEDK